MVKISVRGDVKKTRRSLSRLQRTVFPAAINSALNKTAKKVQTRALKLLAKEIGLTQRVIKEAFTIVKSNFSNLRTIIISKRRAFSLFRFKARQTPLGVKASAWGKSKLYRGAFIVQDKYVAKRKPGGGLKALHGPSVPVEHAKAPIVQAQEIVAFTEFPIELNRELQRRIARL